MKKQLENKYSFSGGPMYKVKVDTSGWAVQEKQIKKLKKTLHKEVTTELIELWNALNEHIAETQELITLLDNRQAALEKRVTTLERPIPSMCGGSDDGKGAWGAGGGCASEPKQECQCKGRKLVYSINGGSEKCRKCDLPLPTNTKEEGGLVSDCCHADFDPFGFTKAGGVWQEKCNKCGKKCEPIWIEGKHNTKELREKIEAMKMDDRPEIQKWLYSKEYTKGYNQAIGDVLALLVK